MDFVLHRIISNSLLKFLAPALLLAGVLNPSPAYSLSDAYVELEKQIQSNRNVDTNLIRNLPSPESAREFQLRAKVRTRTDRALRDLQTALELVDRPGDSLLLDWLNLALLDDPSSERLERLNSIIGPSSERDYSGEIWLLAGKYAAFMERYELAARWAKQAAEYKSVRANALLDLAEYRLELGNLQSASKTLERYLLEFRSGSRDRAWTLKGRLLNQLDSDSEAYLAYSHVIRHFPESLELKEAEAELNKLPLPKAFQPKTSSRETGSKSRNLTEGTTVSETPRTGWKIQLGSFLSRDGALEFKEKMKLKIEKNLAITTARVDGRRYYRVQITGFDSKHEARQYKAQLNKRGIDAFILDG